MKNDDMNKFFTIFEAKVDEKNVKVTDDKGVKCGLFEVEVDEEFKTLRDLSPKARNLLIKYFPNEISRFL